MGNKIKVLITGAGSSVGQAIYKSLKISSLKLISLRDINKLNVTFIDRRGHYYLKWKKKIH